MDDESRRRLIFRCANPPLRQLLLNKSRLAREISAIFRPLKRLRYQGPRGAVNYSCARARAKIARRVTRKGCGCRIRLAAGRRIKTSRRPLIYVAGATSDALLLFAEPSNAQRLFYFRRSTAFGVACTAPAVRFYSKTPPCVATTNY